MQKIDFSSPSGQATPQARYRLSGFLGLRAHPQPDRGHTSVRADVLRRAATTAFA
ncbi:hypothetical protein [Mesorhizobium wenxiniae]|uniref:hypothetical protein n=1 Tax=Mesorhizobium wenxiniae TaxID=2014805 RepID=UPI0013FDA446|nr:hypothetical protein [Mesorhizobium wenxiniae]